MKLLCSIFGHKPEWPSGYGAPRVRAIDNIGRVHADISQNCSRCGERVVIARLHINNLDFIDAIHKNPELFSTKRAALAIVAANNGGE